MSSPGIAPTPFPAEGHGHCTLDEDDAAHAVLEAVAAVTLASSGHTMRVIRLDGEHIGRSDGPLPAPLPCSNLVVATRETGDNP